MKLTLSSLCVAMIGDGVFGKAWVISGVSGGETDLEMAEIGACILGGGE